MKKLFTLIIAATVAVSGMAQKNHKEKGNKHKQHAGKHHQKNNRDRDRDDDRYDYNDGKVAKNLPAKVRASFNRDFPNAGNVNWTKNNGYWIATFPDGIYRTSVTYASNGSRINSASARNQRRTNSNSDDGSIWDKILSRQ